MRRTLGFMAVATMVGLAGCAGMDGPPAASGPETACARLATDYAYHRDRFDPEGVAGVFTPDGVFEIGGRTFSGREAIAARIRTAAGSETIRHLVGNVRVVAEGANVATMTSYVQVVRGAAGALPQPHPGFSAIGEYHDRCERTAEGWRLASRKLVLVFAPPPAS